jgi:hypothetical protein
MSVAEQNLRDDTSSATVLPFWQALNMSRIYNTLQRLSATSVAIEVNHTCTYIKVLLLRPPVSVHVCRSAHFTFPRAAG